MLYFVQLQLQQTLDLSSFVRFLRWDGEVSSSGKKRTESTSKFSCHFSSESVSMVTPNAETGQPDVKVPLLDPNPEHQTSSTIEVRVEQTEDTELDQTLQWLHRFLTLLGFNLSPLLSCVLFCFVGLVIPVTAVILDDCSACEKYQIRIFELEIVFLKAALAAVSLFCLSSNLRAYRIRRFLFVDRDSEHIRRFSRLYMEQIWGSIRLLVLWVLPCFVVKTVREVMRIIYEHHQSPWKSMFILLALIISWTYVSTVSLAASILFHLVCNLQVLHFDDYGKLFETETNVNDFMEKHTRLRYHLSIISHRFRIYLLLEFLVVTVSLCFSVLLTTGYRGMITLINGGDFAISTVVQVVGIVICLHAATKISHRAQRIASLASTWHACVTCNSNDASLSQSHPQLRVSNSVGNLNASNHLSSIHMVHSESDLYSIEYGDLTARTQLASHMSTYHRRQAFVTYLQNNPGGITIFGWLVDRSLLNTIFFVELSLVTFVLGKTIIFVQH